MKNGQISVVVPCFNEEETIYRNIKRIADYLNSKFDDFEIIAVNDGSTDGTIKKLREIEKELPIRIIDNGENKGKGKVVRDGIAASQKEIVMFLDADLGIPIEELEKFVAEIDNGFDMVIASRFVPGLKVIRPVRLHRRAMEKIFRIMRMAIINDWQVKDTQCGFKVFRRETALNIFPRLKVERFAFDAEVIFVANKFGHRIKELPISLQNPPNSHVRFFRDPINMTLDLLKIRINDWKGKYN
ncbi:MAG: glycosyltransferase [Parcubacteria group bacterium]|jgi:dolichyl-phosphate beta-glucosyltransferase